MRVLKEPMLHFSVAGGLLFAAYWTLGGTAVTEASDPVRVGAGEIRWLSQTFAGQWQRPPTHDELQSLVADLVDEELMAREARVLGLDRSDSVVRRRLAQKLGFLIEDTLRVAEPTDQQLRSFYSAHSELFTATPRVSFTQVFFSRERRQNPNSAARATLASLAITDAAGAGAGAGAAGAGANSGDPFATGARFDDVDPQTVANLFGKGFADTLFGLTPGAWRGPIQSAYGVHLVWIIGLQPARLPKFADVRDKVNAEWRRDQSEVLKKTYLAELATKYGVVVESEIRPSVTAPAEVGAAQ